MNVSFPSSLNPSLPRSPSLRRARAPARAPPLHQQVQFQSHFHLTTPTAVPESRALERRKKSTEAISILDLGSHCREEERERERERERG